MSTAHGLLRDLRRVGVRVHLMPDRLRLDPPGAAPDPLRLALRQVACEVKVILEQLPAPGRCQICGDVTNGPTNWPDTGLINCVECAVVVAERMGLRPRMVGGLLDQRRRPETEVVVDATEVGAVALDVMREASVGAPLAPVLIPGGDRVGRDGGTYRVPKQDVTTAGPAGDPTGSPTQPRESQLAAGPARARRAVARRSARSAERRGCRCQRGSRLCGCARAGGIGTLPPPALTEPRPASTAKPSWPLVNSTETETAPRLPTKPWSKRRVTKQAGQRRRRNTTWPGKRAPAVGATTPGASEDTAGSTASTSGPVPLPSSSPSSTLTTERTVIVIVATLPNTGPHPKPSR